MRRLKERNSQYKILSALIIVGLIVGAIEVFGFLDPIKKPIQVVTVPIQLSLYNARQGVENIFKTFGEIGSLRTNNLSLEEENAILIAENAKLELIKEENEAIRRQLGSTSIRKQELIIAKVIGGSPIFSKNLLLIDKGEVHGVSVGMVVVDKNIFIGEIYSVSPRTSSVQLISDPENKIPVITSGKVRGLVTGKFGVEVELINVVQGDKLNVGDLILTTGEGGYPSGLVIGKIKEVKKIEKELFQKAVVELLIDPTSLTTVFLVVGK